MKYGICVCGLNGSGKTTLAKAIAKELGFTHMDIEHYYFTSKENPYSTQRTKEEAENLLLQDIKANPRFVFSAVSGNVAKEIAEHYDLVIYLNAPLDIRMSRIRKRSYDMLGSRALFGGDLYEQEEKFFEFAQKRTPDKIESWLESVQCKVIRLDGTKPISENVDYIMSLLLFEA